MAKPLSKASPTPTLPIDEGEGGGFARFLIVNLKESEDASQRSPARGGEVLGYPIKGAPEAFPSSLVMSVQTGCHTPFE